MGMAVGNLPCRLNTLAPPRREKTLRESVCRVLLVSAAHRPELDEGSILNAISTAVGVDDKTLKVWLSSDLGQTAVSVRDPLTVVKMVVAMLEGERGPLPIEKRYQMLEMGTHAAMHVNRVMVAGLHVL